ncbi:MAG: helix-turn-helix domain-containing protein [Armatimonadota bacterium]|nr:helix-turn-helix domain-containing protein [Armatimonadota bacterium]
MPRKSPYVIELTPGEKGSLESSSRKYTSSYYSVVRAKIVLLAAQDIGNDEIARRLDLPRQIVSKWRKRFFEERLDGLEDRPRRGRPPVFSPSGRGGSEGAGVQSAKRKRRSAFSF